jgi:hypothetical protein
MPPRQTLLGALVTKFDPHGTSSSTSFFDRLEDGWLQIAASGEKKNRPAAGGLNALCMASWNTWKGRSHNNCESWPSVSSRNGVIVRATSSKPSFPKCGRWSRPATHANGLICPRKGEC